MDTIPSEHRELFLQLAAQLPLVTETVESFVELSGVAEEILGANGVKRYILVFQNNTEMRATGGFMGSFAEVKVHDGVIEHLNIPGGGTYDLQGILQDNYISPKPLQLLSARWEFQDANWFPDFPSSARQIIQFYESAGQPSVDGVVAVNATYVADLLKLLGPIDMPEYGRLIDSENFIFEAQKIVELEYDKEENRPKAFIGDLAPKLLDRALEQSSENFLDYLDAFAEGLVERDIQLYFSDDNIQQQILEEGWGGAVRQTPDDYLMLVNTNLGGGKTDGVIEEDVHVDVNITENGTVENTVTIKRTHHGLKTALFSGVNNVNYTRLYVPKGSELLSASGFSIPADTLFDIPDEDWIVDDDLYFAATRETTHKESQTAITEESGKTVFGNWVQTKPGTTSETIFTYRLPFKVSTNEKEGWEIKMKELLNIPQTQRYTLTVQKQSGIVDRMTNVSVHLPAEKDVLWSSHDLERATLRNETDGFIGVLFQ